MVKSLFFTLFAVVLMASCSSSKPSTDLSLVNVTVGSRQATVDGKKVFIVKKGSEQVWSYLYSGIEGFNDYQEGYEYQIQTRISPRTPTASDVSAVAYSYVKQISKTQKDSERMPGFTLLK